MARIVHWCVRGLQAVMAVTNLALSSYGKSKSFLDGSEVELTFRVVVNWYMNGARTSSPSIFNFLVFAPVFSLLSIIYLETIPRFAPRGSHPWASMGVELINTIFYFSGFIALAVFMSRLIFCNGAVCSVGKADAVITALDFVVWTASTTLMAMDLFKGGLRMPSGPRPQMQQA